MTGFPIHMGVPPEHTAPLPKSTDVVIIGGGVIGVSAAYYLAKQGVQVVLVEKGRIAGEQSSRNWGWIRQQGRDGAELPIMMEANRLWKDIAGAVDCDIGLKACGLTYFSSHEEATASYQRWLNMARPKGVDSYLMSRREITEHFAGMASMPAAALHTPSDMRAEPWVAVPALARAAVAAGATLIEACAARGIDRQAGRVAGLVTEQGVIQTSQVIVAGGAWSSLFLRNEGVTIPQLSVAATVAATGPLPEVYTGGANGDQTAFRRREDGGYTLASAGFHEFFIGPDSFRHFRKYLPQLIREFGGRRYFPTSPDGYPDGWRTPRRWSADAPSPFENTRILNPKPNLKKIEEMRAAFQAFYPSLGKVEISTSWAGMIDTMPDIVPVVDQVAALEGLSICTGMSGHGFGIGPAFGRIMADMVTGGKTGHDLNRFRIDRFIDGSKLELGPEL